MKKFKTSAEKRALEEQSLAELLSEKNLFKNVFLRYTHLPLGLVITGLMLLTSWLVERPLISWENLLFCFMGIAAVALFYMLQAWFAFRVNRSRLKHVRNAFVGSALYPLLFALLFIYLAIPQGLKVLGVVGACLLLLLLYHLRLSNNKPLWQQGQAGSLLYGAYLLLLLWIPMLAPQGHPTIPGMLMTTGLGMLFAVLSLRLRKWLLLEVHTEVEALHH